MWVDQAGVVDFVSREPNGDCVLVISDHLPWGRGGTHLLLLQEKLNRYLAYTEAGELYERFPEAKGFPVIMRIYFMHAPDEMGVKFLDLARNAVEGAGFGFEYKVGVA